MKSEINNNINTFVARKENKIISKLIKLFLLAILREINRGQTLGLIGWGQN